MSHHDVIASSIFVFLFKYSLKWSLFLCSLVDSIHGVSGHEAMMPIDQHQQYQLFASSGAIRFPIEQVTEAWKEKVCLW